MVTTGDRWISDARLFTEVTRAKTGGPIYVIGGPHEARLTIYSQQCRAINLVCALREWDEDLQDKYIAVIGAGAAGMTAASALRAIGVPESRLTIYERAASPLYTQRWSYSRFLHPRLFHWPEAGWQKGRAGLPVADWSAGYAAAVRERILSRCAELPIEFCTDVHDVRPTGSGARVAFRRLHCPWTKEKDFDVVLVATGFPPEPKIEGTIGGTYWHALDGLDDLKGDVHMVGDGDGALTEVLMMLIDRFGHATIERLCELLPLTHIKDLHAADLEAQGNPSARAKLCRKHVESRTIKGIFELLTGASPHQRSVIIHAKKPLSGSSFLLNRALVSHLTWKPKRMVYLQDGPKIDPLKVQSKLGPGASVIWRAGVGESQSKPLAEARMTTKGLIASLTPTNVITPFDAGLLTGLLDGLRRPMWTAPAHDKLTSGIPAGNSGWIEPHVNALYPVAGRPTTNAEELLRIIAATEADLKKIGLPEVDTLRFGEARWVSIDVLARAGSCPHTNLVDPRPPKVTLPSPTKPRHISRAPTTAMRCDEQHRLWFQIPSDSGDAQPTRSAVCAIVNPRRVADWVRNATRSDAGHRQSHRFRSGSEVSGDVLRGLSDVAGSDVQTQMLLAALQEQRGDWDAVRSAYVRAGRQPGGKRLGGTKRSRNTTPYLNMAFRRVLLGLGGSVRRMFPEGSAVVDHAIWLMLSAAAADLVTLTSTEELMLQLGTTPRFLNDTWAPRVRMVLTPPGRRTPDFDYATPPEWASALADAAIGLRGHSRGDMQGDRFGRIRTLANEATRQAEAEPPPEPLITLSELGVWAAGTDMDQELRNSFGSTAQEPPTAI